MDRRFKLISRLVLVVLIAVSCATVKKDITVPELQRHIKYLSSDSLKGRLTGTPGDSLAAVYIKSRMSAYGLKPLNGDGFQRFKVTEKIMPGKKNSIITGRNSFNSNNEVAPLSFSENGKVSAEVVFAGYGFSINNDSTKWDDYKGLDVKNKWVMVLRADPEPDNARSRYASFSADRVKALVAKDMGASGVLLVSGQSFDKSDTFDPLSKGVSSVGIPVLRIKRNLADSILSGSGKSINELEKNLNSTKYPLSFNTGTVVEGESDILNYLTNTRNVVMELPGEDPALKDQFVVFGAHFDHLGLGGPGSGSRAVDTLAVHHGADDNASGVAMLIEMAGKFAGSHGSHRRSLVFVAFTGEEEGLFGSKYFTDNPPIDLSKTDLMVNFDMVGRLKDTKDFQVGGVGTADSLKERAKAAADTNLLKLTFSEEGAGPSDHSSFYSRNIPVLYFTTGAHDDYHTPRDTWDKINYKGMVTAGDLIFRITSGLANETSKLKFREAGPKESQNRAPRRRGVTLGIMPDVTGSIKNGLRVEAVTPGKPAALGKMLKGDIITSIDGKPVNSIDDYMFRLSQLKHGQTISVEVLRNNKKEVLIIQL